MTQVRQIVVPLEMRINLLQIPELFVLIIFRGSLHIEDLVGAILCN